MKLLADENFPPSLITILQKKRHDIKRIQRTARGISDLSVRQKALKEGRVIVTFDRDFLKTESWEERVNVMLFEFPHLIPEEIVPFLDAVVAEIKRLKKKKKPFTAIYSQTGVEIIENFDD